MNNLAIPRSLQENLSIQQIGTETLVYDERRHKAFCLNETSSAIWRLANGERNVGQISSEAIIALKVPISPEVVSFALDELRREGLVEFTLSPACGPAISRRIMLRQLGVGAALLVPTVAAIVAPTAAQAYSGCVDCAPTGQAIRERQLAIIRRQQNRAPSPTVGSGTE